MQFSRPLSLSDLVLSDPKRLSWLSIPLLLSLCFSPGTAHGFSGDVHASLTRLAAEGRLGDDALSSPSQGELMQFYQWLGAAMAQGGDKEGQEGFVRRFQGPRDFNARGVRRFLGLTEDPEVRVWGISRVHPPGERKRIALLAEASTFPKLDHRNRYRLLWDTAGQPVRLLDGRPVPFDPMTSNMGGLTGPNSEAHAHFALPGAITPNDDPDLLRDQPWRFARAPALDVPVQTFAADMAELHLDMAILARVWGEVSYHAAGEYLAMLWLGAGLHYLQDAASPLRTVQVGSLTLYERAQRAWKKAALWSGGGLFWKLPTFSVILAEVVANHRLASGRWLSSQLRQGADGGAPELAIAQVMKDPRQDDASLAHLVDGPLNVYLRGAKYVEPWAEGRGAGTILVQALSALGARQAGPLMECLAALTAPALSEPGFSAPAPEDALAGLFRGRDEEGVEAQIKTLARLQAGSLRRALSASERYLKAYHAGNGDTAARRLRAGRLKYLAAAEARRARWQASPPPELAETEVRFGFFAFALALILLSAGLVFGGLRWLRRLAR